MDQEDREWTIEACEKTLNLTPVVQCVTLVGKHEHIPPGALEPTLIGC